MFHRVMFSVYINNLLLRTTSAREAMLADETTIYTSGQSVPSIAVILQSRVSDSVDRMHLSHLSPNPSKTECIILTMRQKCQLTHTLPAHILIEGQQITEVWEHKC